MAGTGLSDEFRVALHDTDAAGVLFFAHLFRHAHDAYEGMMRELGWPLDRLLREGTLALPLVHAEADYRRPMRHGQQVRITAEATDVRNGSFAVAYRFSDGAGQLLAAAKTVHAAMDPRTTKAIRLPKALVEALGRDVDVVRP